jgi:hypothetical protein
MKSAFGIIATAVILLVTTGCVTDSMSASAIALDRAPGGLGGDVVVVVTPDAHVYAGNSRTHDLRPVKYDNTGNVVVLKRPTGAPARQSPRAFAIVLGEPNNNWVSIVDDEGTFYSGDIHHPLENDGTQQFTPIRLPR